MSTKMRNNIARWLAVALVAGVGFAIAPSLFSKEEVKNPPARLNLDESALAEPVRQATSLSSIVQRAAPSVVSVSTTQLVESRSRALSPFRWFFEDFEERLRPQQGEPRRQIEGIGSGVIVTEDGYILTNTHVVDRADTITVVLGDSRTRYEARVVGTDQATDIAVLKVEAQGLPAIVMADSESIEVGDLVLAIGSPFGLGQTVTSGIVSAKGRSGFFMLQYEDFIQTDAPINPGNSGGALVDAQGRLIGINTFIVSRSGASAGVNFAVPTNLARFVMDKIIQDGEVRRGMLGVRLESVVTPELVKEFDLPNDQGALVTQVEAGGPASRAGVQPGDFIVEFNGIQVTDLRSLQFEVAKLSPGTEAELKVIRDGKPRTLSVTLGELDLQAMQTPREPESRPAPRLLEGVEMVDLTASARRQFNIPAGVEGKVLVTTVDPASRAYAAGLRAGSVILEVDRRGVESVDDVLEAAEASARGRLLLRVRNPNGVISYMVITASR
jgi:serine protease Do